MKKLPDKFLFMKVGNHAGETWKEILARKKQEYEMTGKSFWGYGGTSCHPIRQVQPFARLSIREQGSIALVMEPIDSHADPDVVPATEFSRDGIVWEPLPKGIYVVGSRYALVLDEISPGELEFRLDEYEVGIGPSRGKQAEQYLQGRIDKGCFVRSTNRRNYESEEGLIRKIGYTANLLDPFAVLLR